MEKLMADGSGNWIDGLYLVADGLHGGDRARNNGGGAEYYHYTTSNIAKETLMGDVTAAARRALKKMDIRLHSVTPYTDETVMLASTPELDITII
jgi:hypothetical protein